MKRRREGRGGEGGRVASLKRRSNLRHCAGSASKISTRASRSEGQRGGPFQPLSRRQRTELESRDAKPNDRRVEIPPLPSHASLIVRLVSSRPHSRAQLSLKYAVQHYGRCTSSTAFPARSALSALQPTPASSFSVPSLVHHRFGLSLGCQPVFVCFFRCHHCLATDFVLLCFFHRPLLQPSPPPAPTPHVLAGLLVLIGRSYCRDEPDHISVARPQSRPKEEPR